MDERTVMNTLHKAFPSFFLLLALGIVVIISPSIPAKEKMPLPWLEEIPKNDLPPEAKEAARQLLKSISIVHTSIVYFLGPVKPGTLIEENIQSQGEQIVQLEVPSESGTYYVFYIDDKPLFKFVHPVRYAWINLETGGAGL